MRNALQILVATTVLIAACAEPPNPSTPITTVRAVEATELFAAFEFTLDSASTTPGMRVYRVPRTNGRRYTTLRLTMASDTAVAAVQLGLPPAYLKRIALLAKDPLADFFGASLGVDDTTVFAAFRHELRSTTITVNSAPRQEPTGASPQREATQTYRALFNAVPFAQATHGPYRLRIDNIASAEGDSAAVLTILSSSNVGVAPVPADWIPARPVALLGATIRAVNESAMVEQLELDAGERRGDTVTYVNRNGDGALEASLRIELDAGGTVNRVAFTRRAVLRNVSVDFAVEEIFHSAAILVPRSDSALVSTVASARYATNPGTDLEKFSAVAAVLEGRQAEAVANYPASTVRIFLPPTSLAPPPGSTTYRGAPGDFVTMEVSLPDRARP